MNTCGICGGTSGRTYTVKEMMFGTGRPFEYFECGGCGCLQLVSVPADLSEYYPAAYHAFEAAPRRTGLRGLFRIKRNRGTFVGDTLFGRALARQFKYPVYGAWNWLRRPGISERSRILDVGSGVGTLLRDMASAGFTSLVGVDPYVERSVRYPDGVEIVKGTIHDVTGRFDVVMLHHSLEHMAEQEPTLRRAGELLAPGGLVLVRVPITSGWAWEHYREGWAQIDAPRHLFVHSVESLRMVAERAGLSLESVEYDSTEFQFAASALYAGGLPLSELHSRYSRRALRRLRRRAERLNRERRGDQAAFYFRRVATQ